MKPMMTDRDFSLQRVAYLIRNRMIDDAPGAAIVAGGVFGGNLIWILRGAPALFNASAAGDTLWGIAIFVGGLLLASNAFSRMHDGRSGPDWILLPATPLEKYLAALFSYLFVYPIVAILAAIGLSALLQALAALFGIAGGSVWTPLGSLSRQIEAYAFFVIFLLAGSARFRRLPFIKTAAVLVCAVIAGSFLAILGALLVNAEGRRILYSGMRGAPTIVGKLEPGKEQFLVGLGIAFIRATMVFALVYGYALVREKEARDEVQ